MAFSQSVVTEDKAHIPVLLSASYGAEDMDQVADAFRTAWDVVAAVARPMRSLRPAELGTRSSGSWAPARQCEFAVPIATGAMQKHSLHDPIDWKYGELCDNLATSRSRQSVAYK